MYNMDLLRELALIIVRRGIQTDPAGIAHKHNEAIADAPRCPIKLHLCTPDLRPQGRLTDDDMYKLAQGLYGYIEHHRLDVKALGCVPNVGLRLTTLLQIYAREVYGRYWPIVLAHKINHPDGRREIGPVIPSEEYPRGPVWLVDDLVNWAFSKREADKRYTDAGYSIAGALVGVDYRVGARKICEKLGFSLHDLMSIDYVLGVAKEEKAIDIGILDQTHEYLRLSRIAHHEPVLA